MTQTSNLLKQFSVIITNGTMRVVSPYNTEFVAEAKNMGGKWDGKVWIFDARNEASVRSHMMNTYGTDGTTEPDVVSIRVEVPDTEKGYSGPITLAGRVIAKAKDRDSGAQLGSGVALIDGGFDSGGSRNNWCTVVDSGGAVVVIHDFPRQRAERLAKNPGKFKVSIETPQAVTIDAEALRSERERLLARIAEIDALLSQAS